MITSPDGRISVAFRLDEQGTPHYSIRLDGKTVLRESRLGLVREDEDFTRNLRMQADIATADVVSEYEILTAKRRNVVYRARRGEVRLATPSAKNMTVIFQVSNDGVAFRYEFPDQSNAIHKVKEEATSFHLPADALAWLQPMAVARTGYEGTNPSYEEFYQKGIPVGTPSTLGAGWVYPALFRTGDTWLLISEAGLGPDYCGARLRHESPDGEYFIGFPDPRESFGEGPVNPQHTLPWRTPWRIIAIGSLKTIAESTLGTDLADPPQQQDLASIKPGRSSWSWPLLGDPNTTFDVQKRFIDYAAEMGWEYCLIDALWDKQIGYERVEELVRYAAGKNVGILLWYNSAGNWNTTKQTPRDRMLTRESRIAEFEKLKSMGVKGLKIDFFGGDGQSMISYYHDILRDAAPYGFLINFHGATLPRGWQRTYPHLMTMEAIRGFEFITFNQRDADEQPSHCAMLPFTRNVFDPMDFTPVCLDRINNRIQRRTSGGFELALSVLFTSGIQHFAEIPAGMAKMPEPVRDFLRRVPAIWEETKFIDGFPGKLVVLARKGNGRWYVAGINGEASAKPLKLDLSELRASEGLLITDSEGVDAFESRTIRLDGSGQLELTLKPHGGFVLELQ